MRNSTIKPYRETICKACNGTAIKKTIGGYCFEAPHFHYQKNQQKKAKDRASEKSKTRTVKASNGTGLTLGKWFNMQISMMPKECENCNAYLNPAIHIGQRSYIAHILTKRHFESVMLHPLNRMFLCVDCHSKFDNCLSREVVLMKVWPIAVERFNKLKGSIDQEEVKHLRPCFEDLYF